MKYLFIVNACHGSGGLEKVLAFKCNALIKAAHEVTILSLVKAPCFFEYHPQINIISPKPNGNKLLLLMSYVKLAKQTIAQIDFDVVSVCDDGLKALLWAFLFRERQFKLIYERHAERQFGLPKFMQNKQWFNALQNKCLNAYDAMVCLSQSNAAQWQYPNITIIPNPAIVDQVELKADVKNNRVILAVGSHSIAKGYDTMLQIWANTASNFPDWQLHIVGNYAHNNQFLKMAEALNIANRVVFMPPTLQLSAQYASAALLWHPARQEAFGMVIIEAMQHGLPCLTYKDLPGPSDIIQHAFNGYLVSRNENDMQTALSELLSNQTLRSDLSLNALEKAKSFQANTVWSLWQSFYNPLKQ